MKTKILYTWAVCFTALTVVFIAPMATIVGDAVEKYNIRTFENRFAAEFSGGLASVVFAIVNIMLVIVSWGLADISRTKKGKP